MIKFKGPFKPALVMVTVFGLGHMRPAPGTWGSLPPPALLMGLALLGVTPGTHPELVNGVLVLIAVVFTIACFVQGARAEQAFGGKDPSYVVADETAGQAVALLLLPAIAFDSLPRTVATLAAGFLLFRIADILKPAPAAQLQAIKGGAGIVIDDLIAGVYANIVLQFVARMAVPYLP